MIAKECALLRSAFKENDQDYRHRNVAKLMFIHMLGYPTHFGQMECLKLIAAPGFPEKRIGYLSLMLLLDERQEVLMLVTNSLKNDLSHSNQFIVGLALCALGNICTAEMARDLAPEVERLLHSSNSYLRKKAALCSVRIVRKVPDLVEYFTPSAAGLLSDKHHGVLLAGVRLVTELCLSNHAALEQFRKQTSVVIRGLKNLVVSGYAPEYDVGGLTDPFLQVRILRLLRLLGQGDADSSDVMSDILAQVATNTESNKNAGNAILYECVQTIMAIEAIGGLRVLAINILGKFLSNRDNNIRYVALNTLVKVVSVDTQAVQRHRTTIVECVKDSDVSIRRRALDLVYALVNENNIVTLTKELLEYLKVSDAEFKGDLTAKICSLVQKYAPDKLWYIDHMVKLMVEAGSYVTDEVVRALVVVISNAADLHGYTVRSLYRAFQSWSGQESLAQVTVWCIGEYGEMLVNHSGELPGEEPITVTESDVVDALESVLKDTRVLSSTSAYALTALLKLSSRFPSCTGRIKGLIGQYKGSAVLELQQRSIEFGSILSKHEKLKGALLERMPVLDEAAYTSRAGDSSDYGNSEARPSILGTEAGITNGPSKSLPAAAAAVAPLMDLLDLSGENDAPQQHVRNAADSLLDLLGGGPVSSTNALSSPAHASTGGADLLLDILSLDTPAAATGGSANSNPSQIRQESGSTQLKNQDVGDLFGSKQKVPVASTLDLLGGDDLFGAPVSAPAPAFPSIVAFKSRALKVTFVFTKEASTPQSTTIHATYSNTTGTAYTDFIFQAAVPKFMQLQLEPASGSVLPGNGEGSIVQVIRVTNSLHGQKSLVMKVKINYKRNGEDVVEQGQVNNFPPGL